MKVCPKCNGITEEKKAIKCSICGYDITSEPDYSQDELLDDSVKLEIAQKHTNYRNRIARNRALRILGSLAVIGVIVALIIVFVISPKGHVNITEPSITLHVGESITITPTYSDGLKGRHLAVSVASKETDNSTLSFRYHRKGDSFVFEALAPDYIEIVFIVNDDGEQINYNNKLYITILPPKGHVNITETTLTIPLLASETITPHLSDGLVISNIQYRITTLDDPLGISVIIENDNFIIQGLKEGEYTIIFTVEDDGTQANYNNQVHVTVGSEE